MRGCALVPGVAPLVQACCQARKKVTRMPITVQSRRKTRRSAIYSVIPLVFFLATSLALLLPLTAHATVKPERVVSSNEEPAPLFDMETEPLFGGTVLEKWSRAQAQIARELEAVDRCHANDACSPDAQRLIDLSAEDAIEP